MNDTTRTLTVTAGNLRQSHLYVNGHFDFFPKDAFGASKRSSKLQGGIEIFFDGLNETVTTDIAREAKSGKPRRFLRCRAPVGRFYQIHKIKPGDCVALERLAEHKYRLFVPAGPPRLRAAEFFAGIGLVRLALERQGWEVVAVRFRSLQPAVQITA